MRTKRRCAEKARQAILELELFDPERSIVSGDDVMFPIILDGENDLKGLQGLMGSAGVPFELLEGSDLTKDRRRPRRPLKEIEKRLCPSLGKRELALVPRRWERIGDGLVLVLDPALDGWKEEIGRVYSDVLRARYVLRDVSGVSGEMREPDMEVLRPPEDGSFETVHRENGTLYVLDPRHVMFSSGNVAERGWPSLPPLPGGRFKEEVALDMFAGIGYFSLPLARNGRVGRIISVEKNPRAFGYLVKGIALNKAGGKVVPILGDNRLSVPEGIADRVIMGFVSGTLSYLERALFYTSPEGAVVHLHDTVGAEVGPTGLGQRAVEIASSIGFEVKVVGGRRVKSYAPCIEHVVVELSVRPH